MKDLKFDGFTSRDMANLTRALALLDAGKPPAQLLPRQIATIHRAVAAIGPQAVAPVASTYRTAMEDMMKAVLESPEFTAEERDFLRPMISKFMGEIAGTAKASTLPPVSGDAGNALLAMTATPVGATGRERVARDKAIRAHYESKRSEILATIERPPVSTDTLALIRAALPLEKDPETKSALASKARELRGDSDMFKHS